jgi:monofunctional biosynthetic peptidoglycan transglycosylase
MKKIIASFLIFLTFLVGGVVGSLWLWLPTEKEIKGCIVTRMYHVTLCPGSQSYVPLNKISPYLQKTIVMTEDGNFYNHHGFEWQAIEKNAREGWESGKFKRGGSTITQQLTKNMFLTKERTFARKAIEAIITDRIERTLSKKEILERYLNVIEFGKNIYGVKAASEFYFQKTPAELDVVESAFLAMILPNPIKYSQSFYKKELTPFASKRLRRIVDNLFQFHLIQQADYDLAVAKLENFLTNKPALQDGQEVMTLEELEKIEQKDIEELDNDTDSDSDTGADSI